MKLSDCLRGILFGSLCATPLMSGAVQLDDYSHGLAISTFGEQPVVQVSVPDEVYQRVVTDDLSDLRVFNADGAAVPHAVCSAITQLAPTISQEPLPVFRLQDMPRASSDTRIEVQTSTGTEVSVQGGTTTASGPQTSAYVIDARGVSDALRAVQFDWNSPDGASEARVSLQASNDLDQWRTIVAGSTLLRADAGTQQLRRLRIDIPQARYDYLRVERVDRGPPLEVAGVVAERVTPAAEIEPMWMYANQTTNETTSFVFDAGRRAPITFARLTQLPDNTSMHVAIESRVDAKATWITRWQGEVYSIVKETERRLSPPAEFVPTYDREWRVRLTTSGDTFYQSPTLELGYRPARLRFLSQGPKPYTLAFGSRRVERTTDRTCDSLLGGMNKNELEQNITDGIPGAVRVLGGEDALRPLPKQTPTRQIVLWGVLILAVGALVAMALSVIKRVGLKG